ncbi:MAG: Hsp33 family molecular chaperone HslO [Pseudomonadota bacterium]
MIVDTLQPFLFDGLPVRGGIVALQRTYAELRADRDYPAAVTTLLGEGAAATALMASSLKFDGRLTLSLSGRGVMPMYLLQSSHALGLRGMAILSGAVPPSPATLLAGSQCSVMVESASARERYQGIVEVRADNLTGVLEDFYSTSIQVPTKFVLAADAERAGGIMLQPAAGTDLAELGDDWDRLGFLAATLAAPELGRRTLPELLRLLFHEDDLRLPDARPVHFHCDCSRERVERAVRMLGRHEALATLADQGRIEVTCEFCGKRRVLDAIDVDGLFAPHDEGSGAVH